MSECMLFRALPEFGAFDGWDEPHFEPIGKPEVVALAIRNLFAGALRWSRYDEGGWIFAEGQDDGHRIDLMFRAASHGGVDYLVAKDAAAATLVKLIEFFELNFVFDPVRAKYLDPYLRDAEGRSFVAKGVHVLAARQQPII